MDGGDYYRLSLGRFDLQLGGSVISGIISRRMIQRGLDGRVSLVRTNNNAEVIPWPCGAFPPIVVFIPCIDMYVHTYMYLQTVLALYSADTSTAVCSYLRFCLCL